MQYNKSNKEKFVSNINISLVDIEIERIGNISVITMKNKYLILKITNIGCAIISIFTKDRNNKFTDVVLGYDDINLYKSQDKYIGAVIGRCANRISNGHFTLNSKQYNLDKNNISNHLHGGIIGFDKKIFDYTINDNEILFCYISPDGEEGYPGKMKLQVSYKLVDNSLIIKYVATSDKDTISNFTNHTYFNLSGNRFPIYNHYLSIKSDYYGEIDKNGMVTGKLMPVYNTVFDFNKEKQIKEGLLSGDEQICLGNGYDHAFIISEKNDQIILYEKESGIRLSVSTSMPCVQLYTGNYLCGDCEGKNGWFYNKNDGICLETQYFPNSINNNIDNVVLRKGEVYNHFTKWTFDNIM